MVFVLANSVKTSYPLIHSADKFVQCIHTDDKEEMYRNDEFRNQLMNNKPEKGGYSSGMSVRFFVKGVTSPLTGQQMTSHH